jgi:hypothetical protein
MATIFVNYSNDIIGHAYQSQDTVTLYTGEPKPLADGRFVMYGGTVVKNARIWLTGFYIPYNNGASNIYQAFDTNNKPCYITTDQIKNGDWLWYTPTEPSYGYSDSVAMINTMIENHKTILENNLMCAAAISKMDDDNIDIPDDLRRQLYALQSRLQVRNGQLADSIFLESKQTATSTGFSKYSDQLTSFMNDPGIGVAPVVIYIIVSVVITLLSTAVLYMIFSKSFNESKSDIVYSKDLTATLLKKLTPQEYQLLLAENKENAERIAAAASGNSLLNTVKYLAIGFLGYTLLDKFIQSRKS